MAKNTLAQIIEKKINMINNLKKNITIDSLKKKITENNSFVNFKEKIEKNTISNKISINPNELNVNAENFENLLGDDSKFNANKMIEIFKGNDNDFSKAVCLNAAAWLIVMEKHLNFKDSYENVRKFILSRKTYEHLKSLQNV